MDILINWYAKSSAAVRWNNCLSKAFFVNSDDRQSSCLSLALLNIFSNLFIVELRTLDVGYHFNSMFTACLLYSDDIILLSTSLIGLQQMLISCGECSLEIKLKFNCKKSCCIMFGPLFKPHITDLVFCDNSSSLVSNIKYL